MDSSEDYRKELTRRINILKKNIVAGKVNIAEHLKNQFDKSLAAIRFEADGLINLESVDGRIRSLALMITHHEDVNTLKDKNPLKEIQQLYFEFFEQNFDWLYEQMIEAKLSPHQVGRIYSEDESRRNALIGQIDKFTESIIEFWSNCAEPAYYHLRDLNSNKVVFGGDMFPSHERNIASSVGVYVDTIILPDPFIRSMHVFMSGSDADKVYYAIKHSLNILQYKGIIDADLEIPLIAILPEDPGVYGDHNQFIGELSHPDVLSHAETLFDTKFTSTDEVQSFLKEHKTPAELLSVLSKPERLLFDTDWSDSKEVQINRYMKKHMEPFGITDLSVGIYGQIYGRMVQANDLLLKSKRLNGTPIIDAPTSWQYFYWKLGYNSEPNNLMGKQIAITKGLVELGDEVSWFGNVPVEALIEMRKTGALHEIREHITKGMGEFRDLSQENFMASGATVASNLKSMFDDYKNQMKILTERKWNLTAVDVPSWLAKGVVTVGAAYSVHPIFGLSGFVLDELFNLPKLKDMLEEGKSVYVDSKRKNESPLGLMFRHLK